MLFNDFIYWVECEKKKRPIWFELLSQQPVKQCDIDAAEVRLGLPIPSDYKEFILHYYGGVIGFVQIYTLEELLQENEDINTSHFLAISDNGCGDLYGYCIEKKDLKIYLYEHDEKKIISEYCDLFSFICKAGFGSEEHLIYGL